MSVGRFNFALISSALCAVFLADCTNRAASLPDYGPVPSFTMMDAAANPFTSQELTGKVWVADFIYTNCPAECPMMTSRMHSVAKQVHGEDDVRLVSISVDPERDTPSALRAFAQRYGGPTKQWIFLTGTPSVVHTVAYSTFHVGDVIDKMTHSTKFALVDKRGHIRGYYSTLEEDGIPTMLKDLAALRRDHA